MKLTETIKQILEGSIQPPEQEALLRGKIMEAFANHVTVALRPDSNVADGSWAAGYRTAQKEFVEKYKENL